MRYLAVAAAGLALLVAQPSARPAEERESGLAVGEALPAFDVMDLTGPNKGQPSICYI